MIRRNTLFILQKKRSAGYRAAGINLCAAIKYLKIRKVVSKKAEKLIYSIKKAHVNKRK